MSQVRLDDRLSSLANLAEALEADFKQFRGNIAEYHRSFEAARHFIDFHGSLTVDDLYFFGQKENFLRMLSVQEDYNLLPSWDDPREVMK